ncbi:MAG: hypothetical protein AB7U78_20935, partial [Hyphomicrobiaceae bacterium]
KVNWYTPRISAKRRDELLATLPAFDPGAEIEVPLTEISTPHHPIRVMMRPRDLSSKLIIGESRTIEFPRQGTPLKVVEIDDKKVAVFFREMFSNRLFVYMVRETIDREIELRPVGDAQPIFRAATTHQGRLIVVLYDNERRVNEVVLVNVDGDETKESIRTVLPSLEHPAGQTYEMISRLQFARAGNRSWIVAGNLFAEILMDGRGVINSARLPGCLQAQDVVTSSRGLTVLCLSRAQGDGQPYSTGGYIVACGVPSYLVLRWTEEGGFQEEPVLAIAGVPYLTAAGSVGYAVTHLELSYILRRDLVQNHAAGIMDLGINNLEGRVAWSQIDFLNGLLDLVGLAIADEQAASIFGPLAQAAKRRLDLEVYLLDRLLVSPLGARTKAFTVRRQPAIFAVQTSRILLLLERYRREVTLGSELRGIDSLRNSVLRLDGHIEEIAVASPTSMEPKSSHRYLRWPKGSAFIFDGLNVPYNHQNEWAHAVFETIDSQEPARALHMSGISVAGEIIQQFLHAVAPGGTMPNSGQWPYWWGAARAGWKADMGLSINKPDFNGDTLPAWISFRSIDAMSVLAAKDFLPEAAALSLRLSIADLIARGLVYPFVSASFVKDGRVPIVQRTPALSYSRLSYPGDLRNSVWGMFSLVLSDKRESQQTQCD